MTLKIECNLLFILKKSISMRENDTFHLDESADRIGTNRNKNRNRNSEKQ